MSLSELNEDQDDIVDDLPSLDWEEPPEELALDDNVRSSSTNGGREQNMLVLQNAVTHSPHSLDS